MECRWTEISLALEPLDLPCVLPWHQWSNSFSVQLPIVWLASAKCLSWKSEMLQNYLSFAIFFSFHSCSTLIPKEVLWFKGKINCKMFWEVQSWNYEMLVWLFKQQFCPFPQLQVFIPEKLCIVDTFPKSSRIFMKSLLHYRIL